MALPGLQEISTCFLPGLTKRNFSAELRSVLILASALADEREIGPHTAKSKLNEPRAWKNCATLSSGLAFQDRYSRHFSACANPSENCQVSFASVNTSLSLHSLHPHVAVVSQPDKHMKSAGPGPCTIV